MSLDLVPGGRVRAEPLRVDGTGHDHHLRGLLLALEHARRVGDYLLGAPHLKPRDAVAYHLEDDGFSGKHARHRARPEGRLPLEDQVDLVLADQAHDLCRYVDRKDRPEIGLIGLPKEGRGVASIGATRPGVGGEARSPRREEDTPLIPVDYDTVERLHLRLRGVDRRATTCTSWPSFARLRRARRRAWTNPCSGGLATSARDITNPHGLALPAGSKEGRTVVSGDVLQGLLLPLAYDLGRIAADHRVGGDVLGDDRSGSHDCPLPDGYSSENDSVGGDPRPVLIVIGWYLASNFGEFTSCLAVIITAPSETLTFLPIFIPPVQYRLALPRSSRPPVRARWGSPGRPPCGSHTPSRPSCRSCDRGRASGSDRGGDRCCRPAWSRDTSASCSGRGEGQERRWVPWRAHRQKG